MFNEIIAKLGTTVKINDVRTHFPQMVGYVMREGVRADRGIYDIAGCTNVKVRGMKTKAKAVKAAKSPVEAPIGTEAAPVLEAISHRIIAVVDNISSDENLVPDIDPDYVPWGCYAPVKSVISSGIFAPVYVIGESGNGKTLGVEQACASLKREVIVMNITNETSEEDLIGSYIIQNGNMIWKDGGVIAAMRRGAVLCLDEIDQARPAIMALQTVAQGKPYFIKKTNELVTPSKGFALIATANTKGDGASMDKFAGAQVLNEAFLERFPIVVEQDYPTEAIERKILKRHTSDDALCKRLASFAKITRTAYNDGAVSHCLTTRRLVQIVRNIKIFGDELVGVQYAMARFNDENKQMFTELYMKLLKSEQVVPESEASAAKEEYKAAESHGF